MIRFTDFILRRRTPIIIALLITTLLLGYKMLGINMNADFATYLQQSDPLVQQYNKIGDKYGGKSVAMVLIEKDDIFTYENLKLIDDLTKAYHSLEEVSYVTSLANIMDLKRTADGLEIGKLISSGNIPEDKMELKNLKDYVMSKEMYEGNLISYDGTTTLIALKLNPGINEYTAAEKIKQTTIDIAGNIESIYFGGMPFLIYSMTEGIIESLDFLLPVMLLLLFTVLYLGFRTFNGVLVPLMIVMISVVWIIGFMVIAGYSLDMLSGIMPVILLAMGSADGIHLLKRYYEVSNTNVSSKEAIKIAMVDIGKPMILTSITTMVGFISLLVSNFSVISQFGLLTTIGIFVALIVTFLFVPSFLSFTKSTRKKNISENTRTLTLFEFLSSFIVRRSKWLLVGMGIIIIGSIYAIPLIVKDVDWTLCLRYGSKPWQAEMMMRDKFKGSLPVQISVKGDIKEPGTLKTIRYLERYLETLPLVSKTESIASILSRMNNIVANRFTIPETKEEVANLCFLIEGEAIIDQLVHGDYQEALIQAKFGTMQTQKMVAMADSTNAALERMPDNLITIEKNTLPGDALEAIHKILTSRITDNIHRDIIKRDLSIEKYLVREIVEEVIYSEGNLKDISEILVLELEKYLLSEESEIEVLSVKKAETIANSLFQAIEGKNNVFEVISTQLQFHFGNYETEEIMSLAESMERIVLDIRGESKIESGLEKLLTHLSPANENDKRLLHRDLKGDFWELNENYFTLSKREFDDKLSKYNVDIVEENEIELSHTGLVPILKKMEEELTPTQVGSVLFALFFVTIILSYIFRSPLVGIISVSPIILTVLVNFAVIGYLGIGLDSFIAMIASITIGLGTDYSIHFTSRFRKEYGENHDFHQALVKTYKSTGIAIIINAFAVGLGFIVLIFGPCQHVRLFGILTSLTMLTSVLFTLIILPAMTYFIKPNYIRN